MDRVRAEREVARIAIEADRERRLFGAVLSNTPDFIYTFDLKGRFVYVNAALLSLWSKSLQEVVGKNFFELDYPNSLAVRLQRQINEVIETKQTVRDETPYTSRLGERIYEYIFAPVFGSGDIIEAVAGSTRDITDRKRTEAEREMLVEQLREQDRKKDEFLATLAHELRNPLAPLRNGLQLIRLAGASGMIEQTREMMERQLSQLVRLVDDLLDMSRVTSGKLELRRTRLELQTVVDAAVETSRPAIDNAGLNFTVTSSDDAIWVEGDHVRLAQIVSNLLNSAAKYTHRGGHVQLTIGSKDKTAIVSVADDGIGIPQEMLSKVFEMFTQIDRTLEKTTGGLGIGLSLAKGLIEMHAGTIEACSQGEGRGSEFIVRLPILFVADELNGSQEANKVVISSGRLRILVADDNVDAASSVGKLLELLGNDVSIANDGLNTLNMAESYRPDVMLLDISMPKLNGYEVARRIRGNGWGQRMMLIALTGWGQEEDRRLSKDAGFEYPLVKPVDLSHLRELLAKSQAITG